MLSTVPGIWVAIAFGHETQAATVITKTETTVHLWYKYNGLRPFCHCRHGEAFFLKIFYLISL